MKTGFRKKIVKYSGLLGISGALLLFAGLVLQFVRWEGSPFLFSAGALLFAVAQLATGYEGSNFTLRRLYRQQAVGAFLLLATGALMFLSGHFYAGIYFRNEWIITLAISAVFELYTAFRIPQEEEKERKKR